MGTPCFRLWRKNAKRRTQVGLVAGRRAATKAAKKIAAAYTQTVALTGYVDKKTEVLTVTPLAGGRFLITRA